MSRRVSVSRLGWRLCGHSASNGPGGDAVVSFPKSGRTWLRVMMDELGVDLTYTHAGSAHRSAVDVGGLPRASMAGFRRIVFLHRDPRDTVVSGFHQVSARLDGYEGSISAFLRDPKRGLEKCCAFNLDWLALARANESIHVVSYEELRRETAERLVRMLEFLDTPRSTGQIEAVVERNSFDRMRAREASGEYTARYGSKLSPGTLDDPNSFKVRRGKVGGYRDELAPEDVEYAQQVLVRLAYPLNE